MIKEKYEKYETGQIKADEFKDFITNVRILLNFFKFNFRTWDWKSTKNLIKF